MSKRKKVAQVSNTCTMDAFIERAEKAVCEITKEIELTEHRLLMEQGGIPNHGLPKGIRKPDSSEARGPLTPKLLVEGSEGFLVRGRKCSS